jgi:hypothetical protein
MTFQPYNISVAIINKSGFVPVMDNCNSWMVTNTGLDVVTVNGMVLNPGVPGVSLGDSKTIGGNQNEVYKGNIIVAFATLAGPSLEVVQKTLV